MKTIIKYDFIELFKTKKFIIFPSLIGIFALLSPIIAMYLPDIINSLPETDGMIIRMPEPTVLDSYMQYFSYLNETILFVIIFFSVSIFIKDKTKGMLPMILSKPLSRKHYLLSKLIAFIILVSISLLIGLLGFALYTYVLFEEVSMSGLWIANLLQLIYYIFIISICMFFAVISKTYLSALLSSFGVYIFTMIISVVQVGPLKYLPTTLISSTMDIFSEAVNYTTLWIAVISTFIISSLFIYSSLRLFNNQEIK